MLVEGNIIGVSLGLAWFCACQQQKYRERKKARENEEKKRLRLASFLDKRSGLIEDISQSERERLKRIFETYWAQDREYSFRLIDGRSLRGWFDSIKDDYIQFTTAIQPIYFESVSFSIPISAIDLATLTYLDLDTDEREWHAFPVAA